MRRWHRRITRPSRHRGRARQSTGISLWKTVLLGLALMPVICGLTFASLVIASEAALGSTLPPLDLHGLRQLAAELGLLPQAQASPGVAVPDRTLGAAPSGVPLVVVIETPLPPSATAFPTFTSTTTSTQTATFTASATGTATATPSPTPTDTPTPTFTPTSTMTATIPLPQTSTSTRTPTRTSTSTSTRTGTPTPSPTETSPLETPTPTWTATQTPEGTPPAPSPTASPTQTSAPPTATSAPACSATGNTSFETTLFSLINQERQNRGLAPYNLQSQLQAAARLHSTDMACNNFLSHTGSDGSSVGDRVRRQGYNWTWVGENIYATGNTSSTAPQQAFNWWMNSSLHRANLLSPNYTDIGLGYMYRSGSTYGGYFTAVFARP